MIDVTANRGGCKWTRSERLGWVFLALATPLCRLSPRPLWGWRRALLRRFGARIGARAHVYPSLRISIPWNLDLGEKCAVGDRATLYSLGPITLEPRAVAKRIGRPGRPEPGSMRRLE